jgi:anti-anti-sigma factor
LRDAVAARAGCRLRCGHRAARHFSSARETVEQKNTVIHKFAETICLENVDGLYRHLEGYFPSPDTRVVVLDMENVKVCDSSGLRFLLALHRKAAAAQKQLILYRPRAFFRNLLSMTNLAHVFTVADTLDTP